MSSLLEEIKAQIVSLKTDVAQTNVGTVREVSDGVAKIEGLSDAALNEMLDFPGGTTGIALNLEETEVGAIIIGDFTHIKEGDEVRTTGKLLQVPVGKALLGRVVDALGKPIDGKGDIKTDIFYPVEKLAPGIIARKSVSQPIQTGITAIDAMIPIGRGQRELIIGDRATGKTTIAIDAIINQARINRENEGKEGFRPLYSIYVAVGQKNANVARVIDVLNATGSLPYTIVVSATASDSATSQYLAPFAGCAMGEWFMDNGMDAMIIYDDLSKHAVAYRQISLILKRPRVVKPIPATSSISTPACSSAPPVSARNTATARSPRCRSSKRRPATSPPTFPRTSSRSRTARFISKPISSTRASAPPSRSVSPSRASAAPRRSRP